MYLVKQLIPSVCAAISGLSERKGTCIRNIFAYIQHVKDNAWVTQRAVNGAVQEAVNIGIVKETNEGKYRLKRQNLTKAQLQDIDRRNRNVVVVKIKDTDPLPCHPGRCRPTSITERNGYNKVREDRRETWGCACLRGSDKVGTERRHIFALKRNVKVSTFKPTNNSAVSRAVKNAVNMEFGQQHGEDKVKKGTLIKQLGKIEQINKEGIKKRSDKCRGVKTQHNYLEKPTSNNEGGTFTPCDLKQTKEKDIERKKRIGKQKCNFKPTLNSDVRKAVKTAIRMGYLDKNKEGKYKLNEGALTKHQHKELDRINKDIVLIRKIEGCGTVQTPTGVRTCESRLEITKFRSGDTRRLTELVNTKKNCKKKSVKQSCNFKPVNREAITKAIQMGLKRNRGECNLTEGPMTKQKLKEAKVNNDLVVIKHFERFGNVIPRNARKCQPKVEIQKFSSAALRRLKEMESKIKDMSAINRRNTRIVCHK
uniref:H15 domain-containing protein n=1 Tax=Clastoptera arizonana TaxID=38151 RepID=A0A1B6DBX9_9HEMI